MVVNFPTLCPFDDVNQVGVAIKSNDDHATSNHIAILYKYGEEPARLLHFTGRHIVGASRCDDSYLWMDLGDEFTEVELAIVCAHVKKVVDANAHERTAYGFDSPAGYIDKETGKIEPAFGEKGFTCSTFVLEVFEMCGYRIVNLSSWPKPSPKDIKWQVQMVSSCHKIT